MQKRTEVKGILAKVRDQEKVLAKIRDQDLFVTKTTKRLKITENKLKITFFEKFVMQILKLISTNFV